MQKNLEMERVRRKLMLWAPVAIVPSLVLMFVGLGGGKGIENATAAGMVKGVNMTLPMSKAEAKGKAPDKLEIYAAAARDSVRLMEKVKQDPYAAWRMLGEDSVRGMHGGPGIQTGIGTQQLGANAAADRVLSRVAELRQSLRTPGASGVGLGRGVRYGAESYGGGSVDTRAVRTVERLRDGAVAQRDPYFERMDGMLDKVMRIQHPESVSRDTGVGREPVVLLEVPKREEALQGEESETGFIEIGYGDKTDSVRPGRDRAIGAMINGDQTLSSGSTVALRLTEETSIGRERLAPGQLVYGLASLSGERLMISVASLRAGESIVPVSLQVYDLDGLAGIRVPGALTRDVSKESASEALSGLGMASLDPSLGAQAANASLQFAKSLASRKARLVRVSIPAGYRVLLKNTKSITH